MRTGPTESERRLIAAAARHAWEERRMCDAVEFMRALGFTEVEAQRIFLTRYLFERRGNSARQGGRP